MSTQPNMTFTIAREDMLRSKTVEPGWYTCRIKDVRQEPASTDGSINTIVDFIISQAGPFEGVPVTRYFNEKAAGFAVSFFKALGADVKDTGGTFNLAGAVGKTLKVYIKNDMYQNRLTNKAEDFRKE